MLGHISFGVRDLGTAIGFYDVALAPLGLVRVWTAKDAAGYGVRGGGDVLALKQRDDAAAPGAGFHLAFNAESRAAVDAFYAAALAAGASDNGAPGLRPHYGPGYYAGFVRDPEGWALEAVCRERSPDEADPPEDSSEADPDTDSGCGDAAR
jgi:catechol 2,3-dioxygenase-like lactoylglutathione lyase family enzyme